MLGKWRKQGGSVAAHGDMYKAIAFQATGLRKPLAVVSKIVEKGNKVVFSPAESYILNIATGKRMELQMENGTYVMNVKYVCDDAAPAEGFNRQR